MEAATAPHERWGRPQAVLGVALFLCLFASQAGVIVLTPVLSQVASDLGVSTAAAGQLRTVSGLAAGLTAVALGTVARGLPLRLVLTGGAVSLGLGSVASATAPSFAVLVLAQALIGLSVAALLIGGTVAAAEWAPEPHRTRVLSWALVGPPTAWIVGMPLIGAVGEIGWRWAFLLFPLAAAVVAGLAVVRRPRGPRDVPSESLADALHDVSTARWVLGELLANSAWAGMLVYAGALFTESYGVTSFVTGIVLAAGAAAYVAGNVYFRRVVECRARVLLIRLALVLAVGAVLFGAVRPGLPVSAVFFAAVAFLGGGRTLIASVVGLETEPARRRAVMGARAAAAQLGYFLGSAAAGGALAAGGYPMLGLALALLFAAAALPFLVDVRRDGGERLRPALTEPACSGN